MRASFGSPWSLVLAGCLFFPPGFTAQVATDLLQMGPRNGSKVDESRNRATHKSEPPPLMHEPLPPESIYELPPLTPSELEALSGERTIGITRELGDEWKSKGTWSTLPS